MPRRRLRGAGRDLRPRVGAARRAVGPAAARRGVQACPRLRRSTCSASCPSNDKNQRRSENDATRARRTHARTSRGTAIDEALIDAADAIADMAQRVQLNGPEPTYASEKLGHALYKAAEGLALCDVELDEVTDGGAPRPPARPVAQGGRAMTLGGVRAGDIVLCDRMGRRVLRDRRRASRARARGRPDRPARHLPPRQGARGARHLAQEPRPERPRRRGAAGRRHDQHIERQRLRRRAGRRARRRPRQGRDQPDPRRPRRRQLPEPAATARGRSEAGAAAARPQRSTECRASLAGPARSPAASGRSRSRRRPTAPTPPPAAEPRPHAALTALQPVGRARSPRTSH